MIQVFRVVKILFLSSENGSKIAKRIGITISDKSKLSELFG